MLVQHIPVHIQKMDFVGDVHGELHALQQLLSNLGYSEEMGHPDSRVLVFSGDIVDRGPHSVSALRLVMSLVRKGFAFMVCGNHELNFLKKDYHEGSGWSYHADRHEEKQFEPCEKASESDLQEFHEFLNNLPVILIGDDVVVAHAVAREDLISALERCPHQTILEAYQYFQHRLENSHEYLTLSAAAAPLLANMNIYDRNASVQPSELLSDYYHMKQQGNPLIVALSGVECKTATPFYVGGKWRFVQRDPWWHTYNGVKRVIVGHYWRKHNAIGSAKEDIKEGLFTGIGPFEWMGLNDNVFCVDYSVGKRFLDRNRNLDKFTTTLGALRWPEMYVMLESGETFETH